MNGISNFIKWFFWLMLGMVIFATTAMYIFSSKSQPASNLPEYSQVPAFALTSHTGETFGLEQMKGKINVVDFFFTNCGAGCPRMTTEMRELYHYFSKAPNVQFISISVDPEIDTLEQLREFATGYGVTDDRWKFLRGPLEEVSKLAEKGFLVSGDFPANHSTKIILADQKGSVRGFYDSDDKQSLETLKEHIQQLSR